MSTREMRSVLEDDRVKQDLKEVYHKYDVTDVSPCSPRALLRADATVVQLWVLTIAGFIGVAGLIASITVCCMHYRSVFI